MYKTLFTLSLLANSVAAYAQQTNVSNTLDSTPSDIERVVVSGDFRQTTLDQLSASATILDQERLRSRQPSHIDSVAKQYSKRKLCSWCISRPLRANSRYWRA